MFFFFFTWSVLYHCFLPRKSASLLIYNGTPALDLISVIPEILFSSCAIVTLVIPLYFLYLCSIWIWLLAAGVPWIIVLWFLSSQISLFDMSQIRNSPFTVCHLSLSCSHQYLYLFICIYPCLTRVSLSITAVMGDYRSLNLYFQVQPYFHISSKLPQAAVCGIKLV